jgi:hypothetical protein
MATAEPLTRSVRPVALGLALWCGLSAGCVELNAFVAPEQAPAGVPFQMVATWEKRVMWTPDTVHNGQQIPTLAGRLYFFGEEVKYPLTADGAVTVDLYDDRPVAQGSQSVLVERWLIDEATLRRLKRKDFIGYGYTLVLPSKTVQDHPDLNAVHLTVKFTPKTGSPLYDPGRPIIISLGEVPAGVTLAKVPAPGPVQQTAASQPAAPPQQQPVRPALYQLPPNQPPPIVPVQAVPSLAPVAQPPAIQPPPSVMLPPPIIMRPAPNLAPPEPPASQSSPSVAPPADPSSPPLRVRIVVDKNNRD